ncbi:MAG TPA: hypothetical protein DCP10_01860 [Bacteroidales bacterium]|nr:hypothetical protein [Bacteroidales bacterium]
MNLFNTMDFHRFAREILMIMFLILLFSCHRHEVSTIGVTRLKPSYEQWLLQADSNLRIVNLYDLGIDSALLFLDECDGLLITGGEDIYPAFYGKECDTLKCEGIDRYRDTLEMMAFKKALHRGLPVFGICRGLQLINVALGGTLLADVPSDLGIEITHRSNNNEDCLHPVCVNDSTLLLSITGIKEVYVNSKHHQGIDRLANDLKASAFAPDQLIEAIEWKEPSQRNFLMGVQWHPERLTISPEMSQTLANEFIHQVKLFHALKK